MRSFHALGALLLATRRCGRTSTLSSRRRGDLDGTLDLFLITHPHIDHVRGAATVMEHFDVERVITDGLEQGSGDDEQKALHAAAGAKGIALKKVTSGSVDARAGAVTWARRVLTSGLQDLVGQEGVALTRAPRGRAVVLQAPHVEIGAGGDVSLPSGPARSLAERVLERAHLEPHAVAAELGAVCRESVAHAVRLDLEGRVAVGARRDSGKGAGPSS